MAHAPGEYLLRAPVLDLNLGLGDGVQAKYETAWASVDAGDGETASALANSVAGVKWRFVDRLRQGAPVDLSLYPQLSFHPISSRAVGPLERETALILPVEAAASLGPIDLAAEAGYRLVFAGRDGVLAGLVAAHSFGDRLTLGADLHLEAGADLADEELALVLGAVIALAGDHNLLVSAGRSPRGADSGDPDLLAYLGFQLRL